MLNLTQKQKKKNLINVHLHYESLLEKTSRYCRRKSVFLSHIPCCDHRYNLQNGKHFLNL